MKKKSSKRKIANSVMKSERLYADYNTPEYKRRVKRFLNS